MHTANRFDRGMMALTWSRMGLGFGLAAAILTSAPETTIVIWIAVIIFADLIDGIVARRAGIDHRARRILDATVDKLTIHAAFLSAVAVRPDLAGWYAPLAVRDLLVAIICWKELQRFDCLLMGRRWHKLASLSAAGFGAALVCGPDSTFLPLGIVCYGVNVLLLLDFYGASRLLQVGIRTRSKRLELHSMEGVQYLVAGKTAAVKDVSSLSTMGNR